MEMGSPRASGRMRWRETREPSAEMWVTALGEHSCCIMLLSRPSTPRRPAVGSRSVPPAPCVLSRATEIAHSMRARDLPVSLNGVPSTLL